MNFHVSNSYLKSLCAYLACQIKLLKEEISLKKKSRFKTLEKDFNNRKEKLREALGITYNARVICLKLKRRRSSFEILYGLFKTHKKFLEKHQPFRLILSVIKTPSYNLAKVLVPVLQPITKKTFTLEKSFEFSKEISGKNPECFMVSLESLLKSVVAHFTRIRIVA